MVVRSVVEKMSRKQIFDTMTSALNLTLKIKQTPEVLAKLQWIKANFASQIQKKIDDALRASKIVHFARVLVIKDLYIQVITEYDGDERVYTEFFRKNLLELFSIVFALAENPPTPEQLASPDEFFKYSTNLNIPSLGTDGQNHVKPQEEKGYFFQAYPSVLVEDILAKFL